MCTTEIMLETLLLDDVAVAKFIVSALKDPRNPTKCSPTMTTALSRLLAMSDFAPKGYLNGKFFRDSGLFKTLFSFIALERSPLQIQSMFNGWLTCDDCSNAKPWCKPYVSAVLHDTSVHLEALTGEGNADMERFIGHAFRIISQSLSEIQFKTFAQGLSKSWPYKLSDLFPSGPDKHMKMLFEIFKISPDRFLTRTLAITLSLCRTNIYNSFSAHPFIERSSHTLKFEIDRAIGQVASGLLASHNGCKAAADVTIARLWITGCTFFDFIQCLAEPHVSPCLTISIIRGLELHYLQLCSLTLYIAPYLRTCVSPSNLLQVDELKRGATQAGRILLRGFHAALSGGGRFFSRSARQPIVMPHHPLIVDLDTACNFGSLDGLHAEINLAYIFRNLSDNFCASFNCYKRLETTGTNFKKCMECQVVFYCSVDCQATDWKMKQRPFSGHKLVCKILRRLHIILESYDPSCDHHQQSHLKIIQNPTARLQKKVKAIQAAILQAQLSSEEVKLLYDWIITVGVNIWGPLLPSGLGTSERPPGFDDYGALIERLTDPRGPFKGPKAKTPSRLENLPLSAAAKREKKLLLEHSLEKQAGGNSREIKIDFRVRVN
ncbi:hypothetical protein BJ165DRAFT_1398277 [Panaeolus papilionaceus]|nr:hypothetical protein BJ165DRAFT_1398277 [Panaeolus papilionaceus]